MNNSRSDFLENSSCEQIGKPYYLKRNESEREWNRGLEIRNKRQTRRE